MICGWQYQTGIGDEGATKIAEALPSLGQLQWLELVRGEHGGREGDEVVGDEVRWQWRG